MDKGVFSLTELGNNLIGKRAGEKINALKIKNDSI